jgi:choline dehydrogenase-like flavoprotein
MNSPGYHHADRALKLSCDVVIVGSGAGGSAAARTLAQAGHDVVVLEMGVREQPESFTQREEEMLPRLFQDAAARTTADGAIHVLQGKGVGGSTLHNINLCKRVPDVLLDKWSEDQGLPDFPSALARCYDQVESDLSVSVIDESRVNRNNALFRRGAQALGWRNGPLKHNRVGCIGSGFCELGCAYDAKQNAAKIYLPQAVQAGARVISGVRVDRVLHRFARAKGVAGRTRGGHRVHVQARAVVLSASATGSPALLLASGLGDRYRQVGAGLHLHPGGVVGGIFDRPVRGWEGIPQSWECTEFLSPTDPAKRVWLVPNFGHPVITASQLPGFGAEHASLMQNYPRMAALSPMLHDYSVGRVGARRDGHPVLRYRLNRSDRRALAHGFAAGAALLLAAGALKVVIPTARATTLTSMVQIETLANQLSMRRKDPPLSAVHPMGGLRLGSDPRHSAVDSHGTLHGARGIWVADGSLMPSSTGVPPQLTIYALGLLVGAHCADAL